MEIVGNQKKIIRKATKKVHFFVLALDNGINDKNKRESDTSSHIMCSVA